MACDPAVQRRYGYNGLHSSATVLYQTYGGEHHCEKGACAKASCCASSHLCQQRSGSTNTWGNGGNYDTMRNDHKLKGVDVKPRISLADDPRDHSGQDFISVIHTPLPPTPTSSPPYNTTQSSSLSYNSSPLPRVTNEPIYSPVRKGPLANRNRNSSSLINNFNTSFKKTSKSSDSLINSTIESNRVKTPLSFNSSQNLSSNRPNQSITNINNTTSVPDSSPGKSFSSNPNLISPTSPVQPNNSPISPSYSARHSNIQNTKLPQIPSRSNSISHSLSHYPGYKPFVATTTQSNTLNHHQIRHQHPISFNTDAHNNSDNSHTVGTKRGSIGSVGSDPGAHFGRSYSTRSPSCRDLPSPVSALGKRVVSEGHGNGFNSSATIVSEDSSDVILREHSSAPRRDHRKRSAGLLSPSSIAEMSFKYDSGTALEGADSKDLGHLLEWELSLDSSDLRSHAWYHGNIPRARAEELVIVDGSFLVRDCTTQPGNFVLTCCWESKHLHFVIQKTMVQPDTVYEHIQYELEDDAYDTIPDLICAYVGNKKLITNATRAKICKPVTRSKPLSYYESLYKQEHQGLPGNCFGEAVPGSGVSPRSNQMTMRTYDNRKPPSTAPAPISGSVGCNIVRSSQADMEKYRGRPPLEGIVADERSSSSDGIICQRSTKDLSSSTQSLPRRIHTANTELSLPPSQQPSSADQLVKAPPKPSRVPSFKVKARKPQIHVTDRVYAEIDEKEEDDEKLGQKSTELHGSPGGSSTTGSFDQNPRFSRISEVYQPSGSDSGNGSGDSIQTTSDARNRDSQGSLVDEGGGIALLEEDSLIEDAPLNTLPDMDPPSCYNLDTFSTFLLPQSENLPLDATALNGIRSTIMESGSRVVACHLTYADLEVINGLPTQDFGLGVNMGLEMVTLPQGSQLRKDIIERTECMRLLVAVTVLKADDIRLRAEIIHRWIQIAIDTKTATGNLYGFNNIMLGLCNPQIQRLTATWHMVRQKFTDSAFSFESKLRSTLKAMNECTNPQAPNTIIPHILPFVILCERDLEDIYSLRRKDESLLQWESSTSDYGLQMLLMHLQEGRNFAQNLAGYRRNAELILEDPDTLDDLILDVFRTEFQLKFLFGNRGALRNSQERHTKFQQILSALSAHCESSVESSV